MKTGKATSRTLVLGIGNVLMSDEGVGVHAVRALQNSPLGSDVECLDGGTGGFHLLGPLSEADRVIIIDAAALDSPPGTITRLEPRFSSDYPRTLTAHDIGLKDMLDAFYLSGKTLNAVLLAISISPDQQIGMDLSLQIASSLPSAVAAVLRELRDAS